MLIIAAILSGSGNFLQRWDDCAQADGAINRFNMLHRYPIDGQCSDGSLAVYFCCILVLAIIPRFFSSSKLPHAL